MSTSWAAAERRRVVEQHARIIAERQQSVIDAEVRQTRRELLAHVRRHGGAMAVPIFDDYFLSIADRPAVVKAVLDAACTLGNAAACDLQVYEPGDVLRMAAHRGFRADFLAYFDTVDKAQPTACAAALSTRAPVFVDDVTRSPIFDGHETRVVMLDAGSRSVQSHPLLGPDGRVLGVLSFHYPRLAPGRARTALIAAGAAHALAH